jgi:D-arabinose 1-dehydrogenase-like Zn-dependent alcohol dehydrogenase
MTDYSFRGVLSTKEESNTSCWGVTEAKGPFKRLYFKLPALAEDEVRIKVLHTGMCHSDCFKVDEMWGKNCLFPLVPGHEIIAEVEKVGSKVTKFKPGDAVGFGVFRDCCSSCEFCRKGDDQLCTSKPYTWTYDPHLGGYSSHMHVNPEFLFHLPKTLNKSKAAPILCAGVTVFAPLKRWGIPGARCGVVGMGGLGHMAIQIANKMGMEVVAISTSPDKEKEARHFGAKEFVCSKNEDDMKRIQKKEKLDIILNTAFIPNVTSYMYAVKQGGVFIQTALPDTAKTVIFDNFDAVVGQKVFTGSIVGSRTEVEQTLAFCDRFDVYPVCENYSWAEFPKAYNRLHDGLARYRCVVDTGATFDNL